MSIGFFTLTDMGLKMLDGGGDGKDESVNTKDLLICGL
jgi:hypothetical protein